MRSNIDLKGSENIKTESDEEIRLLLCSICKNVLMRPRVCDSCGVASCEECLNFWHKKTKKCPKGCEKFKYTKPSAFLHEHLKNLSIKCANSELGCNKTINYEQIEEHQGKCEYATVHCKNEGCEEVSNRGKMNEHDLECIYKKSACNGCNETLVRQNKDLHSCTKVLNQKIAKLEEIVRRFITKMEDAPSSDHEQEEFEVKAPVVQTPLCFRHEFIQDYLVEFSIYHQTNNYYQISLPGYAMPVSATARCVILRVVVHDCSVSKLFTRCIIKQVGSESGVNLSNYIIPTAGVPTIFEVFIPWSNLNPAQIGIQWDKSFHAHQLSSTTISEHGLSNLHTTQAIPAQLVNQNMASPGEAIALPSSTKADLTHGVIYIGISGFLE